MNIQFTQVADYLIGTTTEEFIQQGHNLTGKLVGSIDTQTVVVAPDVTELQLTFFKYGMYLNKGVSPSRIPFGGGSRGGTSQYIQGLMEFVRLRRLTSGLDSDVLGVAIAIAKTQAKEGMPTRGSYRFSSNSRRKNWVDYPTQQNEAIIEELLLIDIEAAMDERFEELLQPYLL